LSLAVLAGAIGVGCSSTDNTGSETPDTSKEPPGKPSGAAKGDGAGVVLAVNKLFLGNTDRKGAVKNDAWMQFGYNLDGKISTKESTDHCKPYPGAQPATVKADGKGGVDNAFGKILVPIIVSLAQDAAEKINDNIADGSFTIMTKIDTLGTKSSYVDLPAALYVGSKLMMPPPKDAPWDQVKWPVVPELLDNPKDITSSKVKFPSSYVNEDLWVSGTPANLNLQLNVGGFGLTLGIVKAIITMKLSKDRKSASDGIIAGVLPVEPLIAELRKVAGRFSKDLCTGNTFDSIAEQIKQASDILADGSNSPGKTCDAISIGLGFESKAIQGLGDIAPAAPPAGDPCAAMGGMGGMGSGGAMGTGGAGTGGTAKGGAGGMGGS
jgi:hypothetical protein